MLDEGFSVSDEEGCNFPLQYNFRMVPSTQKDRLAQIDETLTIQILP